MEYTKDFPSKLKQLGFELIEMVKEEECHYEDWRKTPLMVCVDHSVKTIIIEIDQGYQGRKVNVSTLEELKTISEILNRTITS